MKRDESLNIIKRELDNRGIRYRVEQKNTGHRKVWFTHRGRDHYFVVGSARTIDPRLQKNLKCQINRFFRLPATGTSGR
jgi:hypothetical protein